MELQHGSDQDSLRGHTLGLQLLLQVRSELTPPDINSPSLQAGDGSEGREATAQRGSCIQGREVGARQGSPWREGDRAISGGRKAGQSLEGGRQGNL